MLVRVVSTRPLFGHRRKHWPHHQPCTNLQPIRSPFEGSGTSLRMRLTVDWSQTTRRAPRASPHPPYPTRPPSAWFHPPPNPPLPSASPSCAASSASSSCLQEWIATLRQRRPAIQAPVQPLPLCWTGRRARASLPILYPVRAVCLPQIRAPGCPLVDPRV